MRVAIIGAGYVGLVTGVGLASKGHDVVLADRDAATVARLNAGTPHIHERDLPDLLRSVLRAERLRATGVLADALAGAEIVLIAVGTPTRDGAIDLRQVERAAHGSGAFLAATDAFLPVVVKSTVVPGTTDGRVRACLAEASGRPRAFGLGMNPEFLREGDAVADVLAPDRIVLGHEDAATLAALERLYAPWDCDKLRVSTRTAELIKYANNALLAVQISAANEIAGLADALGGIDAMDVMRGVGLDRRWRPVGADGVRVAAPILDYLVPGCGFGGSCLPKDVQALRTLGRAHGQRMQVLDAVLAVNAGQPAQVGALLAADAAPLDGRACLVLGLAFKPGTDDVRDSASLAVVADLLARGARVAAHDPVAAGNFRRALGVSAARVRFVEDWRGEVAGADAVVVATAWPEYRALADVPLAGKRVLDARRMFAPADLPGARYLAIGRRAA
jgi:UDPglucose 6-dehydrogenase